MVEKPCEVQRSLRIYLIQITPHSKEERSMRQRSDYPTFSDQEMARRHRAIQALMDQEGMDALLVYGTGRYSSDVYWLTDWPCSQIGRASCREGVWSSVVSENVNSKA